jgi:hypothetical protein
VGACGTIVCPRAMGNMYCTGTGVQGDPCVSSAASCDQC